MNIFKRQAKKVDTTVRSDGYRVCDVELITQFQQQYEAQYPEAVRAALYAARDRNFVVTKQNLMRFISNQQWDVFGTYQ